MSKRTDCPWLKIMKILTNYCQSKSIISRDRFLRALSVPSPCLLRALSVPSPCPLRALSVPGSYWHGETYLEAPPFYWRKSEHRGNVRLAYVFTSAIRSEGRRKVLCILSNLPRCDIYLLCLWHPGNKFGKSLLLCEVIHSHKPYTVNKTLHTLVLLVL